MEIDVINENRRPWRVFSEVNPKDFRLPKDIAEASWNMAFDETLYRTLTEEQASPFLRFYQWKRPAITIGISQNIERTMTLKNCQQNEIEIVRRITGGRGILHGDDLTFSLGASLNDLGLPIEAGILEIYAGISALLIGGFHHVGIDAEIGGKASFRASDTRGDCFSSASKADLVERETGCKLLGAALHKRAEFVLMQGSIPLYSQTSLFASLAKERFVGEAPTLPNAAGKGICPLGFIEGMLLQLNCNLKTDILESVLSEPDRVRTLKLASDSYSPVKLALNLGSTI